MFSCSDPADRPARCHVTVSDVVGLQRLLTVLIGRTHRFTRVEAEETGSGTWAVRLELSADPARLDLVAARLQRLPSVLAVEVHTGEARTAAG